MTEARIGTDDFVSTKWEMKRDTVAGIAGRYDK
jgi:hypothetical protein